MRGSQIQSLVRKMVFSHWEATCSCGKVNFARRFKPVVDFYSRRWYALTRALNWSKQCSYHLQVSIKLMHTDQLNFHYCKAKSNITKFFCILNRSLVDFMHQSIFEGTEWWDCGLTCQLSIAVLICLETFHEAWLLKRQHLHYLVPSWSSCSEPPFDTKKCPIVN